MVLQTGILFSVASDCDHSPTVEITQHQILFSHTNGEKKMCTQTMYMMLEQENNAPLYLLMDES